MTLTAVSALSLHFLELYSFFHAFASFYRPVQNLRHSERLVFGWQVNLHLFYVCEYVGLACIKLQKPSFFSM